ncbi:MAG: heavy metal-binding domain-containing protein [Candidatus Coatesbacteria bacterium]
MSKTGEGSVKSAMRWVGVVSVAGAMAGCGMMGCGMSHGSHDRHAGQASATTITDSGGTEAVQVWACPMGHYTGDKPGKCPKCAMDLVQQKKQTGE